MSMEAENMLELKQLDLNQLLIRGELSVRSANACSNGGLENLHDILVYFSKNLSFRKFRNCGAKSDEELRELCLKYGSKLNSDLKHTITDSSTLHNEFESIRSDDSKWRHLVVLSDALHSSLTVRSKNVVCTLLNSTVFDLDQFVQLVIQNPYDFESLRNAGPQTKEELNKFRNEVKRLIIELDSQQFNKVDQLIPSLSRALGMSLEGEVELRASLTDSSSLHNEFESIRSDDSKWKHLVALSDALYSSLTVRSKNVVCTLLNSTVFDLDQFVQLVIQNPYDIASVRNAGPQTKGELNKFRNEVKRLIVELDSKSFNKIDWLISSLSRALGMSLEGEGELRASLENSELNLIQFFDQFVLNSEMFSARDKDIVRYVLQKKGGKSDTAILEQIRERHSVTRERVRQIALKLEEDFNNRFQFVRDLFDYSYGLNINTQLPLWKITHQPNNSNYRFKYIENSKTTLANLLSLLKKNVFYTLSPSTQLKAIQGGYDQTFQQYRNLRVYCTVSTQLIDEWTLKSIIEHVYKLIVDRVHKDYVYTFQEFKLSVEQLNVVKTIVAQNFELPEEETGVLLARNTMVTTPEVIEEILMEADEPINLEQIHKEYLNRFPSAETPLSSIHSALNRREDRFIFFRGEGVSRYGLKEWRDRGLIPGNIKNMCLAFIQMKDEPVHIHELWKHVAQHRKTTARSIRTNLGINNIQFIFYEGGFIGLTSKNYTAEQIEGLKQIGSQDSGRICTFIKSQRFYNYDKLIRKFANELGLKSIQIVYIIETKSSEGTFKIKGDTVYYNNSNEDLIIEKICEDLSVSTVSGFNPYRVDVGDKRLLCRVQIISEAKFSVERERIEFDNSAISLSDFLGLLVYHKSSKTCLAFISKSKGGFESIVRKQYLMSGESGFICEQISDELLIYRFPIDLMSSFALAMRYSFVHNSSDEDDLSIYNIEGLNKMGSYVHITAKTEQLKGQPISLLEAKEIYTRLKIRQKV